MYKEDLFEVVLSGTVNVGTHCGTDQPRTLLVPQGVRAKRECGSRTLPEEDDPGL